ncbi:histidinol-phosphatase [Prosthecobacter sp. SYSU 5D2]|uniref:histidinol-phosphatase n=1 Tax=Prosthecobacter sp. SYSU 5D2 TaxID=3134134 RepID=UPI0031FEE0BA
MSKTTHTKSKAAKKAAPSKTSAKKPASKPAPKSASKTVAKKAPAKPLPKVLGKKTPAKKAAASQKAPAAKKSPVRKKAAPAPKKTAIKKPSTPAKKTAVAAKKPAPAAKKAAPIAKKAVPAPKKVAVKAPVKVAKAAPKVEKAAPPAPTKAAPVKAAPAKKPSAPKAAASAPKTTAQVAAAAPVIEEPLAAPKPPVMSEEKPVAIKSGALFYDSHMHTPLCKHAVGEPEEYAAQGLKSGLKGIIFTCHCPMPDGFWPSVRMSDSEFDTYVSIVQRAAQAYRGKLDVCLGLESEFYPGHEKWIEKLHQRADFDYILGGLHWQSKDYLAKFETGTIENFRRSYFEHLAQSAETGLYDCLAHPDLVKNYHPDSWCFAIIKNTVTTVLDRIAKTGVAMELNTSGLNKSYSEMNPGNEMLRMMAERKIPIVVGSDAHKPGRVGEHFITALNNLSDSGYEEVCYFKKRQRIDVKISDVLASIRRAIDNNS